VCAELAIDAVEAVAQRLSRNAQLAGDRRRVVAFGEEFEDAVLVVAQCLNRRVLGRVFRKRDELSRGLQHAIDERGVEPARVMSRANRTKRRRSAGINAYCQPVPLG